MHPKINTRITLIITAVVLLCGYSTASAQESKQEQKYRFIRNDSIPMFLPDTIVTWSEHKVATKGITTRHPLYYYAALKPTLPLIKQYTSYSGYSKEERANIKSFGVTNGMIPHYISYKTVIAGDTLEIDSHEKFREIFAPVESVQEAIAFAYIFTDSKPMYNLDFLEPYTFTGKYEYIESVEYKETRLKNGQTQIEAIVTMDSLYVVPPLGGWKIFEPEIISSYVKEIEEGYELLLYHYVVFGGSHPYLRRLIKVTFDGNVEIIEECQAFANMSDYGLHVD